MTSMNSARLQEAVLWASEIHFGQWRDGDAPLPYITHPLEVMGLLRNVGGIKEEDHLIAAALHDVIEESDVTLQEIGLRFGVVVHDLVEELTRSEPTEEETRGLSKEDVWTMRSNRLLAEIKEMSKEAQAIKLADRLSNIRSAHLSRTGAKLERYIDQTRKILLVIRPKVNPKLWKAVEAELPPIKS